MDFKDVEESFRARYDAWLSDAKTTDEIADELFGNRPRPNLYGW